MVVREHAPAAVNVHRVSVTAVVVAEMLRHEPTSAAEPVAPPPPVPPPDDPPPLPTTSGSSGDSKGHAKAPAATRMTAAREARRRRP